MRGSENYWHRSINTQWIFVSAIVIAMAIMHLAPTAGYAAGVLDDFDGREGAVDPSSTQRGIVSEMGASASWNKFGTPSSLIKYGDFLATGLNGPDAKTVARNWVDANKTLFRLSSVDGLKMMSDEAFPHSEVYAVTFRQEFGGLRSAEDGILTVGVVGNSSDGWKIGYASATTTGDTSLTGAKVLSPADAFIKAAANVGRAISAGDIINTKTDREWTIFGVNGFTEVQRARLRALPTPANGVRQVYETIYLENAGGLSRAYIHYIDAENGTVWMRKDIVEQSHPTAATYSGTLGAADGACDIVDEGPWVIDPGETVGTIVFTVEANLTTNDSVIHLYRDGAIVASQDTLFSPEVGVYSPSGGVPAGSYDVEVCDYVDGGGWVIDNGYQGQITFTEGGAGDAGVPYPPKWDVFPANPLLGNEESPWNMPNTDSRSLWCWVSDDPAACMEVFNLASRAPWDYSVKTNAPTFTTSGNNALSGEAWASPLTPGGTSHRPFSVDRNYSYSWTNEWSANKCLPVFTPGVSQDISAAVTNLFAMHNRMHDWSYFLGFTERRWNAQDSNFGNNSPGTLENDPVIGNAQAGAATGGAPSYLGRDNANMITLPDGVSPITNMYLWQPIPGAFYAPCVDGDYDMAVIGHEYGHMTENRMIGKGDGRSGHHAGAMGESFGDFSGAEYLNEYGFVPVSGENRFSVGAYATGNHERGIRNYNMSYPRTGAFPAPDSSTTGSGIDGPRVNPLNFSNIGYDITGSQVHADGEIWSATNYDVRQILVEKYNADFPESDSAVQKQCADGQRSPSNCPGNRRWIQIVFDAMLLMPTAPSMLEARDAYLAADQMRFGGANQAEIWLAFARRGFGAEATSSNGVSNDFDTDPKPDFQSPTASNALITFETVASDEGGVPVPARIFVGHYEARVSPIADTQASTGPADGTAATAGESNLDNVAGFAPGEYEFVAQADGYGYVRFSATFAEGETKTVTIEMPTNRASVSKGATATGDGVDHQHLIDDTEATNWDEPSGGAAINIQQPQVTVDLAGTDPLTINRIQVSAMLLNQNRFTALREFKVQTSTDGVVFTDWITSGPAAFPGYNPRPVAPEMILRSFDGEERQATHVRIIALNNQCTGNAAFQGEQDNDPLNPTDCRDTSITSTGPVPILGDVDQVLAPRHDEVHIAELQVFGSEGGVDTNEAPVANDDAYTVVADDSITFDVRSNDADDSDAPTDLTVTIVSGPANGNATVNGNGTVTYDHQVGNTATSDSFTYKVTDSQGAMSNVATVSITIDHDNGGNGGGGNCNREDDDDDDDDFDDDGKCDDEDDDDDNDGVKDDDDDDDDNDGIKDDDDADDDNDGYEDKYDSESTSESKSHKSANLATGQFVEYNMVAKPNTVALGATATNASGLLVEIFDPQGVLVNSSLSGIGNKFLTVPALLNGSYTVRITNISSAASNSNVTLVSSSTW